MRITTVGEALDEIGRVEIGMGWENSLPLVALPLERFTRASLSGFAPLACHPHATHMPPAAGFGRANALLLCYCGLAWLADACEIMLMSFVGPAVHCNWKTSPAAESSLTSVVSSFLDGNGWGNR